MPRYPETWSPKKFLVAQSALQSYALIVPTQRYFCRKMYRTNRGRCSHLGSSTGQQKLGLIRQKSSNPYLVLFTGGQSKYNQILSVKKGKYISVCVYLRSWLLRAPEKNPWDDQRLTQIYVCTLSTQRPGFEEQCKLHQQARCTMKLAMKIIICNTPPKAGI